MSVRMTARGRLLLRALWVVLVVVLIGYLSATTPDPCAGKTGDELSFCEDLNYP